MEPEKIIFSTALFVAAIGFANAQSEGTAKKCDTYKRKYILKLGFRIRLTSL